jgi:hypothetical protein
MVDARYRNRTYYFIDIELVSRRIIGWGTEPRATVETQLTGGYHRLFLSKGQFNKLETQLVAGDSPDAFAPAKVSAKGTRRKRT